MERYSASEVARRMRDVLEAAARAPVLITRHRRPRFVLLSIEQFRRLSGGLRRPPPEERGGSGGG